MSENYVCYRCLKNFCSLQRLKSHQKRKIPCELRIEEKIKPLPLKRITINKSALISNKIKKESNLQMDEFAKKVAKLVKEEIHGNLLSDQTSQTTETEIVKQKLSILEKQFDELKGKTSKIINNINNNLQIVCVKPNDNYLDMLKDRLGDFDRALDYIKDCALSEVAGDCKLIEKIYLESSQITPSICYANKSRTKIQYFNENGEKTINLKDIFYKIIANNLQNSYLKGANYLINKNLESRGCPNKFLEDYDLQTWNKHIYYLSDQKYQRRIFNQLNMPSKLDQSD